MKLNELKSKDGSRKRSKVVGRGISSGHGKTSTRGNNGQGQRSGCSIRAGFEGGQTPLYRRYPKFQTNERPNKRVWTIVNLKDLQKLSKCNLIDPDTLLKEKVITKINDGVRVLGSGELDFKTLIKAHHFSDSAKKKIEKAGGKWEIVGDRG